MSHIQLLALMSTILCSGCGAIGSRITGCCGDYFSGVRGDALLVAGKAEGGTGCDPLVGIVDMPFSLVADVIFIPHDFRMVRQRSKNQYLPSQEDKEDEPQR